ncbi:MAG: hypothetical protein ACJA0H_001611, partial [Francisellaceae bacterium]
KAQEKSESWFAIFRRNYGKILFSLIGIGFYINSLIYIFGGVDFWIQFVYMIPSIMFFTNTLLAVLIFGKTSTKKLSKNISDYSIQALEESERTIRTK